MELLLAVILGVVQGVFEWLPVSSEAVISIILTQLGNTGVVKSVNTAVWLHTGTMFAALLYFRKEFLNLIRKFFSSIRKKSFDRGSEDGKLLEFVFVATLVTGIIGGPLYFLGLKSAANSPELFSGLMGVALLLTGLLRFYSGGSSRQKGSTNWKDSIFAGILQGFSIIPGVSRSGSTVFGLLYRDFDPQTAFRLSFLLSVPAILAANIVLNLFEGFTITIPLIVSSAVSFIVGYASIDLVLRIADRTEVAYLCFVLAALSFVPLVL
ncbi:MAG: undecaprenyl-diphosphate phosphatase [Nanohaloarchaea archaeon]|nr:undecaprenyl-diphosphate phosphatase [Candidatus Nanohaloarchaea archaeon]